MLSGDEPAGVEALLKGLELWGIDKTQIDALRAHAVEGGFAALAAAGADLFETQKVMFTPRLTDIAYLRAAAGQPDAAFAALEAAAATGRPVPRLPALAALLRSAPQRAPRWPRLMEKVRLVR